MSDDRHASSFIIQELVPPDIFSARGERAWELLDVRALLTLQALRNALGPLTVNNWHAGGGQGHTHSGGTTGAGSAHAHAFTVATLSPYVALWAVMRKYP